MKTCSFACAKGKHDTACDERYAYDIIAIPSNRKKHNDGNRYECNDGEPKDQRQISEERHHGRRKAGMDKTGRERQGHRNGNQRLFSAPKDGRIHAD